jgi:hypothetical protein
VDFQQTLVSMLGDERQEDPTVATVMAAAKVHTDVLRANRWGQWQHSPDAVCARPTTAAAMPGDGSTEELRMGGLVDQPDGSRQCIKRCRRGER